MKIDDKRQSRPIYTDRHGRSPLRRIISGKPRRKYWLIVLHILMIEIGVVFVILPWLERWDFWWYSLSTLPFFRFALNPYFRGFLSGIGLAHLYAVGVSLWSLGSKNA